MKWLIVDRFNKDHVDVFTKRLKLFLMYIFFYENKPKAARNKGFITHVNEITIQL